MNNDAKRFWNNVSKMANKNATARVNKIGDSVGESEICNIWHDYFQNFYNSIQDNGSREMFLISASCCRIALLMIVLQLKRLLMPLWVRKNLRPK